MKLARGPHLAAKISLGDWFWWEIKIFITEQISNVSFTLTILAISQGYFHSKSVFIHYWIGNIHYYDVSLNYYFRRCVNYNVTLQAKTSLVAPSGISRNTVLKYSVTKTQPQLCIVPVSIKFQKFVVSCHIIFTLSAHINIA